MPGYSNAALHKFSHPQKTRPKDAPRNWTQPTYSAKIQYAEAPSSSGPLPQQSVTRIQKVIGTMIYYSIAVDPTMLVAIGTIVSTQATATKDTVKAVVKLLNYAASHPDATIRHHASGMLLHIHSDGSYISAPKLQSRAGDNFFLSNVPIISKKRLLPNGPFYVTHSPQRHVLRCSS